MGGNRTPHNRDIKVVEGEKEIKTGTAVLGMGGGWILGRLCYHLNLNTTVIHDIFHHG